MGSAVLADKSSDRDGNVSTYQIGQNLKFKSLSEHQLGDYGWAFLSREW